MELTKTQMLDEYVSVRHDMVKLSNRQNEIKRELVGGSLGEKTGVYYAEYKTVPPKVKQTNYKSFNKTPRGAQLERVLSYIVQHDGVATAGELIKELGVRQPYNQLVNLVRKGVLKKTAPGTFELVKKEGHFYNGNALSQ